MKPIGRKLPALACALLLALPCRAAWGDDPPSLAQFDPAAFDRAAAAHLLSRAGFGGTPREIDALQAMGLDAAVEAILDGKALGAAARAPETPAARPLGRSPRRELAGLSQEERQKKVREATRADQQQFQ